MSDAPWAGRTLSSGRYQIIDRLAAGARESVFLALDHHLGAEVAIWMPRASESGQLSRLRALARWNHPHLVRVLDIGEEDGHPFAVTEALAGGSLQFRRFAIPDRRRCRDVPGELAGWLPQVAEALDFLHARGTAHGDVRPGNVFFDAHGRVYLAAFGTDTTSQGRAGDGEAVDRQNDQKALALMVSRWLSNCGGDPELAEAVHRGLSADPIRRYRDCSTFARAVLSAAQGAISTGHSASAIAWTPPLLALPARRAATWALGQRSVMLRLWNFAPWAAVVALALWLAQRRPRPLRTGGVMKQIAEKTLQPSGREIVRVEKRRLGIARVPVSPATAPTPSERGAIVAATPVVSASVTAATLIRLRGWGNARKPMAIAGTVARNELRMIGLILGPYSRKNGKSPEYDTK